MQSRNGDLLSARDPSLLEVAEGTVFQRLLKKKCRLSNTKCTKKFIKYSLRAVFMVLSIYEIKNWLIFDKVIIFGGS